MKATKILNKKRVLGMTAMVLAFGMVITSCSTFMSVPVNPGNGFTYDILGYVGSDFDSYDEAFAAAKKAYPAADAVVVVKGKADDKMLQKGHLLKVSVLFGYYAVKFTKDTNPPAKKFLGIF